MGKAFNETGAFVPLRERREIFGALGSLNAELVLDVNGDESALVYLNAGAASFNATVAFRGSVDGTNFFPVLAVPYFAAGSAGSPGLAQPLITEAINATNAQRVYALKVGQLKKLQVMLPAWTSGLADITVISESAASIHPAVFEGRPSTLFVSATAAAGAIVTATLPLVAGLRHFIDFISVTKFASAALTAGAAPVLVTTTNLPGSPVMNFSAGAEAQGTDVTRDLDFGSTGLAASAAGTATTVVGPATTGVIWRINVGYRLGL